MVREFACKINAGRTCHKIIQQFHKANKIQILYASELRVLMLTHTTTLIKF